MAWLFPRILVMVTDSVMVDPPGATVVTDCEVLPVALSSSVTVSVTVRVPPDGYVLFGVTPLPVVPSPKLHA